MVAGCACITKVMLFVLNVMFVILGLILVVFGSLAVNKVENCRADALQAGKSLISDQHPCTADGAYTLPATIIVVGLVIFIISSIGFTGAIRQSVCLLITYCVMCIVLAIAECLVAAFWTKHANEFLDRQNNLKSVTDSKDVNAAFNWIWNSLLVINWITVVALCVAASLGIILGCKIRESG